MPNSVCVHDVIPASRQHPSKLSATYNGLEPSGGRSQIGLFPVQIRPRQILLALIVLEPTQLKKISLSPSGKSPLEARPSRARKEGRIAIVTDVGARCGGRLSMRWTSAAVADGEVVWS